MGNISLNSDFGNVQPIEKTVLSDYPGVLYLTNKRIVFIGSGDKSFQISFEELLSFNLYQDGLEFIVSQKNFGIQLPSEKVELFATALAGSIRNNLNKDNEKLLKGKMRIENGENLIAIEEFSRQAIWQERRVISVIK